MVGMHGGLGFCLGVGPCGWSYFVAAGTPRATTRSRISQAASSHLLPLGRPYLLGLSAQTHDPMRDTSHSSILLQSGKVLPYKYMDLSLDPSTSMQKATCWGVHL